MMHTTLPPGVVGLALSVFCQGGRVDTRGMRTPRLARWPQTWIRAYDVRDLYSFHVHEMSN